jgi:ABC-type phosphate transport system substrate-binding protein
MKRKVRHLALVLMSTALALSIASCSNSNTSPDTTGTTSQAATEQVETASPETTKAPEETAPQTKTVTLQDLQKELTLANYPTVDGSTATIPLAIGLVQKITGCSEGEAEETIAFNTTDKSYYALDQGKSDLLLVYPPAAPTIAELDVFNTMDVREIGLDALVFIVNEDNPVDSLTSDQIRGIYSGKITNWSEVGGDDMEIVPFQRPELSGSQTLMLNLMMKDTFMMAPSTETVAESMADVIDDIAAYNNSANAIGYSVYYYAKNMYEQPGLKFIAIDGVAPSSETINSREYGYASPFYAVIPLNPDPLAKDIMEWLLTGEGQQLVKDMGYVPIQSAA